MMSGSLRRHRHRDRDEDATAFAHNNPSEYDVHDESTKALQPVVEDEENLGRAPSFMQRLRGTASDAIMRIRSPYENLDRPDRPEPLGPRSAVPPPSDTWVDEPRSTTAYLAAAAQREFLAAEGGSTVSPNDERVVALRAAFIAANGPIPAEVEAVFAEMGDRGMCIMETWLAEHAPEALPLKPVSTLARMPTQGSGNLLQPQRRLPEGSLGLSGYRSVNLKSVPTLTRGNTLNNNNDRMLARLANGSDRYAPFAQMVREVLASNLELAKQLRANADVKGSSDSADAFQGMEVSPSLAKALDELNNGGEYKGDEVQAFFLDPAFNGIKQAESDAQVPATSRKRVRVDPLAAIVSVLFMGAFGFYMAWRIIFTLPGLGSYLPYGIAVLAVECLGALSLIPYALTIMWYTAKEDPPATTVLHYHVRVLIPCYREPLSVVGKTVTAALSAPVPFGCRKTVYVCDDGKDPVKRSFCHALCESGHSVVYVSGRSRAKREINGKSCNINNVTSLLFPTEDGAKLGSNVPFNEVLAVFDADQECKPTFFMRTLPLLDVGRDMAMVLTPQTFYNAKPESDILNHLNVPFWHYTQVGYDALNIISCTGTNFLVRARAFMQAGQFPTHTLTEDFALGIRLKASGWKCKYVEEYLAVGEAPDDLRNCFQQRSRWAKGHFQLFFSRYCPLLEFSRLGLFARLMYTSVIINYFSAFIATPVLLCVPLVTIWVGIFPLIVNTQAALAITVYYVCTTLVVFYVRTPSHIKAMWFALVANTILWFAYLKALVRATVGRLFGGLHFKATAKGSGASLAASGIQDTWIHVLSFCALVTTFVIACIQLARGSITNPIVISMAWILYALIPETLLLYYWTLHRVFSPRVLKWMCFFARLLRYVTLVVRPYIACAHPPSLPSFIVGIVGIVLIWPLLPSTRSSCTPTASMHPPTPPDQYGDLAQPAALTTQFQGSQVSGQFTDSLRDTFPAVTWRGDSMLGDASIPLVNASLAGNYTDWLLKSGYFDDTLALDVTRRLRDVSQAAAKQQTLLAAVGSEQQSIVQAMQQQLGTLATADPAGKELANEATAIKGTIDSLLKQLAVLQQQVVSANTSSDALLQSVQAFNTSVTEADTTRLPLDRQSRDRLGQQLLQVDATLASQLASLSNLSSAASTAQQSLSTASTAAQSLASQAGSVPSVGIAPNVTNASGRRRLQQNATTPPPPPPPTPEQQQQIEQNNLQFQQQQDLLTQQASRRASDTQLRASQTALATALRAAFDALATAPPATTLAADLQALTGTLAQTAQALGSLPTAPESLQVKLEDVASGSLWDVSRYANATLLPSIDLRGGFITNMGAGNIKSTPPIAFSTAMWALTLLAFPRTEPVQLDGGPRVVPDNALRVAVRQGAEYLRKTFIANTTAVNSTRTTSFTALVSRVGFPEKESLFVTRPENADPRGRTAFAVSQEQGAADLAGLVAGGLAAAATVLRAQDAAFADACIATAQDVFRFGIARITPLTKTDVDIAVLYNTTSVLDDLAWGAAWLFRATNDTEWLAKFTKYAGLHLALEADDAALYAFNMEQTFWGANAVVSQGGLVSNDLVPGLVNNTETFLKRWMCGGDNQIANSTRRGLALHPNFTTTGTTENAAFLAAILGTTPSVKASKQETFQCWALSQVRYVLGDGGQSLLGGFGEEPPQYAQDAGIACAGGTTPCDTFTTRFSPRDTFATLSDTVGGTAPPLVGGMVAGPLVITDDVQRERPLNSSRVGIENNAGIVGALAGIAAGGYGSDAFWQRCQQMAGAVRINPVCGTRFTI